MGKAEGGARAGWATRRGGAKKMRGVGRLPVPPVRGRQRQWQVRDAGLFNTTRFYHPVICNVLISLPHPAPHSRPGLSGLCGGAQVV